MNNRLKANLGRPRAEDEYYPQSSRVSSGQSVKYEDGSPSWESELLEEYQEERQQPEVPSNAPFAMYEANLQNPDEDIMSMDFFCQGANVLPAPTTILERPRVAPPTPPCREARVRSTEGPSSSNRQHTASKVSDTERPQHRLKLAALFGLEEHQADNARELRRQQDAELERQALEASRKFEAKRQRNLEREREREYLMRKEAERQSARTKNTAEPEYYEPIVVNLGASSGSRSDHHIKIRSSHSHPHSHPSSHSQSKAHSHSHSRSKEHKHSHSSSSSHKHKHK